MRFVPAHKGRPPPGGHDVPTTPEVLDRLTDVLDRIDQLLPEFLAQIHEATGATDREDPT